MKKFIVMMLTLSLAFVGVQAQQPTDAHIFGDVVDALRIREKIPEDTSVKYFCTDCGDEIVPAHGKSAKWLSDYTTKQYGKPLCTKCATKAKQEKEASKAPAPEGYEEV